MMTICGDTDDFLDFASTWTIQEHMDYVSDTLKRDGYVCTKKRILKILHMQYSRKENSDLHETSDPNM